MSEVKFTARTFDSGRIELTRESTGFESPVQAFAVKVIETEEEVTKRALISLGWTPPCSEVLVDSGLTFNALREANCERIKSSKYKRCEESWTPAHWMQATMGELGELANLLKKVDRGDFPLEDVIGDVARELADVQTYLDILALKLGVDLGGATVDKFNEVSERVGSNVKLAKDSALTLTKVGEVMHSAPGHISWSDWPQMFREGSKLYIKES